MKTHITFRQDGTDLSVHDCGTGNALVFQHGLGGSEAQVAQVLPQGLDWRRITTECRGHGSSTLGTRRPFSIAMFAADVIAAADKRGIGRFIAGGISMGAAIALHLAKKHPERVKGLILVRPAWSFACAPENLAPIREIAALLRSHSLADGQALFAKSATAQRLRVEAPDNLASLLGYFERPDAAAFADVLGDVASDGTGVSQEDAANLAIPALVLGNRQDAIHPLAVAQLMADTLPNAHFLEVPAKATATEAHFAAVRTVILQFLNTEFKHRSVAHP
ncbi:alpha/beta fold hydrolase [Rhizobium mongolense]|uniref:Pimeloyl-ACP methyl ester carboxylesterase n=2 Tax=Rhizobium mongolense TaxID=57676 RepID=A0ABR6IHA3_9HYPH|nr:alpha/beta hydrolase [Rhizobium mongolense]MBB4227206.1 pimeloyl-ACP methyl ester carboxylesterase [Rhizobium mongolense]TVZ74371.1 pimeloyl-ACP methyl ester carboxylesterase [Rhizobium mongolense USDA 1844]